MFFLCFQNRHRGNFIWECKQNEKTDTLWKTLSIVVVVVAAAALAFWANDPHQLKFRLWKNRFRTINWTLGPTTTTSLFVRFRFTNVLISFSIPFSSNPLSLSFFLIYVSIFGSNLSICFTYLFLVKFLVNLFLILLVSFTQMPSFFYLALFLSFSILHFHGIPLCGRQ